MDPSSWTRAWPSSALILRGTSGQIATHPVCLIFAILLACDLDTQHCMQRTTLQR